LRSYRASTDIILEVLTLEKRKSSSVLNKPLWTLAAYLTTCGHWSFFNPRVKQGAKIGIINAANGAAYATEVV
jgi:hypothetical protein